MPERGTFDQQSMLDPRNQNRNARPRDSNMKLRVFAAVVVVLLAFGMSPASAEGSMAAVALPAAGRTFAVTRATRGQEDSGQAELLASGVLGRETRLMTAVAMGLLGSLALGVVAGLVTVAFGGGWQASMLLAATFTATVPNARPSRSKRSSPGASATGADRRAGCVLASSVAAPVRAPGAAISVSRAASVAVGVSDASPAPENSAVSASAEAPAAASDRASSVPSAVSPSSRSATRGRRLHACDSPRCSVSRPTASAGTMPIEGATRRARCQSRGLRVAHGASRGG